MRWLVFAIAACTPRLPSPLPRPMVACRAGDSIPVVGAVVHPDVVPCNATTTLVHAIDLAGGLLETATCVRIERGEAKLRICLQTIREIADGRRDDVVLAPGDVILAEVLGE